MILRDANEKCKTDADEVDVFSLVDPLTADDDLMNMRGEITIIIVNYSHIIDHLLLNDIVNIRGKITTI